MSVRGLLADEKGLQIQGIGLTAYVYQLKKDASGNESINVEKITYTKNVGGS